MSIDEAFNKTIAYYDDWMKKALPNYNDLFGSALAVLPFPVDKPIRVLDLGAGTGLFSKHVLTKYPHADFVLCDVADKMLDVARQRFADQPQRFKYQVLDYRRLAVHAEYDLVISSLSIHHLEHPEKRALFGSIYDALKPDGVFINIDQVRGETPNLQKLYWQHWLDQVRSVEKDEARIRESIDRRTTYDKDALMADQLAWLKEAGFTDVDCVYKNFFVGVFLAVKQAA